MQKEELLEGMLVLSDARSVQAQGTSGHLGAVLQRQGVPQCVCEGECQEMDGAGGTAGLLLKASASWLGDALWGV